MRITSRSILIVLTSMAAFALTASAASATEAPEIVNEKTGTHCAFTGANQCSLHQAGVASLRLDFGIFGEAFEVTCNLEVESRLNETGGILIDAVEKTPGDANCPTVFTECTQPWQGGGEEDGAIGRRQSNASICVDPAEGPVCQGNLAFDLVEIANEREQMQFNNATVGLCEIDVDMTMESTVTSNAQIHANHP